MSSDKVSFIFFVRLSRINCTPENAVQDLNPETVFLQVGQAVVLRRKSLEHTVQHAPEDYSSRFPFSAHRSDSSRFVSIVWPRS